ncbi:T9SS type A sorting domain-containing protein [candidate division KSB1 bacterium]|nr:T9SS type A sorting domain-containing protein [candidate division KSB1 bacterium]
MMKKIFLIGLLTVLMAASGYACESGNIFMHPGDSRCFQVCAGDFFTITLEGGGRPGFEATPVLVWGNGCAPTQTNCDVVCDPLTPPDTLILGGDGFNDSCYYGLSNDLCLDILLCHAHDGPNPTWTIEIFGWCDGCFCLTFERQLAVNLLDFSALAGDREVQLNWTTASETDNQRFEIVRNGNTVTTLEGAGNSTTERHYSWTDSDVVNGTEYSYELVAVDVNGNRGVLDQTAATPNSTVGVVTEYALLQNFPNPFNPETQIAFDLLQDGFASLKVYNLLGQQIASLANSNMSAGHHVVSFDGSAFASGVYLYKLDVNGFSATKKFVLLK